MTKISSHPGVRSDLFTRPLDKTRITDFFGGVAQVEVVSPDDTVSSMLSDSLSIEEIVQEPHPPISLSLPLPSSHATAVMTGFFTRLREWRVVRAWASVGLIGVLVGWVVSQR